MTYTINCPGNENSFYSFEVCELRTPIRQVYTGSQYDCIYTLFVHFHNAVSMPQAFYTP